MKLFEPGKIGKLDIKNRIVLAPMGVGRMGNPDLSWGERVREYYVARARGGTGLITTMLIFVSQELEPFAKFNINVYSDSHLNSLAKIFEEMHKYGAKVSVQLTAGFGRVLAPSTQHPDIAPISASATPCFFNPERLTRAITTAEAEALAKAFGLAAKRCVTAGADAIELHGHEGYLLDQFMSGLWNKRTDKYGGSREKRLTFAREAIASIKETTDLPVIYRYGIDHYLEGGRTVDESLWIARQLEAMGFDALHVDAGCYETHWWPHPTTYQSPGLMVDMSEKVKAAVKIPVIAVGKLNYPAVAEKVLQEGKADFIAIGRGLLADPDWPNKVRENRIDDIRPCIGDNYGCMGELVQGRATSCTVNPACGHEKEWAPAPVSKKKSLLIVGGGPAGMEAACVAASRGITVTLWEKGNELGGNLLPASVPEFKKDLRDFVDYQVSQLRKSPVTVELNKEATAEDIIGFGADCVILATGAFQEQPDFIDGDGYRVLTAIELLTNGTKLGKDVLVVGGGLIGCETAVYLARKGHRVTVISRRPQILTDVNFHNVAVLYRMLIDSHVEVLTETKLSGASDGGIVVVQQGKKKVVKADSLVFSEALQPCNHVEKALGDRIANLYSVGDCVKPRRLIDAIWEAYHAALKV